MLTPMQVSQLKQTQKEAADPQLKAQLAITLGVLGPTAQATGSRLIQFRPDAPPPAPMPPEKKDKEKEEK